MFDNKVMDIMLPAVNQRIKIIIDSKFKGNVTEFSRELGYSSPQKVNRLFKIDSRTSKYPVPSTDMLDKISNTFEISLDELVKGVYLNEIKDVGSAKNLNFPNQTYYEPPKSYMQKISEFLNQDRSDDSQIEITPVYNKHITSEKVSGLKEDRMPDELLFDGTFKECDLVLRHTDPAMNGFMNKNSYMGIKQLTEASYRRRIIPGKAYVIVLENYVIERFLHPGKEKDLLLRSVDRELNPDFEISFEEIIELWLIKAWKPMFEAELV